MQNEIEERSKLIDLLKQSDLIIKEPIQLRNGETSDLYIDIKKAYGDPEILNSLVDRMWYLIDKGANCVAAAGHGGIPLATGISSKYGLRLILVRDKQKNHGKRGLIDGYIPTDTDKVAIVDDVFTSGTSLRSTAEALKSTKVKIVGCYVVCKRGEGDLEVPLKYLITSEHLTK